MIFLPERKHRSYYQMYFLFSSTPSLCTKFVHATWSLPLHTQHALSSAPEPVLVDKDALHLWCSTLHTFRSVVQFMTDCHLPANWIILATITHKQPVLGNWFPSFQRLIRASLVEDGLRFSRLCPVEMMHGRMMLGGTGARYTSAGVPACIACMYTSSNNSFGIIEQRSAELITLC